MGKGGKVGGVRGPSVQLVTRVRRRLRLRAPAVGILMAEDTKIAEVVGRGRSIRGYRSYVPVRNEGD